jgi:molybdate transport system ATP-binding protein
VLDVAIQARLGSFELDVAFAAPMPGVTALFGRSGAGKSSIVQAIAGLVRPRTGHIRIGGAVLFDSRAGIDLAPERRRVGYVFQDARLFPHMTVERNLTYGFRRAPAAERGIGLTPVVELLGISPLLARRPQHLSGGERQRVALGRALLAQPRLLLMDEPLAALDAERKAELLPYLERLHAELALPIVYVTHAIDEVARLADTLVVVEAGRVAACGPLSAVLARGDLPLLGDREDALNVIDAVVVAQEPARGLTRLGFAGGDFRVSRVDRPGGAKLRLRIAARDVILATERPASISIRNVLAGRVAVLAEGRGGAALVTVAIGATSLHARITADAAHDLRLEAGHPVFVLVKSVAIDRG